MKKNIILAIAIILMVGTLTTACQNKNETKSPNGKYDYLVLVNKYSQLPDNWEKNVELVSAKNAWMKTLNLKKKHIINIKN